MFFRFGRRSGAAVPPAGQALQDIHGQLQQQQQVWADKLAHDMQRQLLTHVLAVRPLDVA